VETADFQNTGVSITSQDSSWANQAATLEAYVVERSANGEPISCAASGTTDSSGKVSFSNLPSGLYLLVSDQKTQGSVIYKSSAVLLTLPYQEVSGGWNDAPTIYAKNSIRETRESLVDLTVVKVWQDTGYTENRPQSVTVTLYQDEEALETVTLSESNSWRHTWKDLNALSDYYLVEQNVPTGYTVTTVQDGTTFVVTNTYNPSPNPTPSPTPTPSTTPTPTPTTTPSTAPTPTPSTSPSPSSSPVPDVSPEPSVSPSVSPVPVTTSPTAPTTSPTTITTTAKPTTSPTTTTTTTKLPQTGQLWWPVTILALLGLLLLLLGWGIRGRGDDHES
jgi:hypothetical protein